MCNWEGNNLCTDSVKSKYFWLLFICFSNKHQHKHRMSLLEGGDGPFLCILHSSNWAEEKEKCLFFLLHGNVIPLASLFSTLSDGYDFIAARKYIFNG